MVLCKDSRSNSKVFSKLRISFSSDISAFLLLCELSLIVSLWCFFGGGDAGGGGGGTMATVDVVEHAGTLLARSLASVLFSV